MIMDTTLKMLLNSRFGKLGEMTEGQKQILAGLAIGSVSFPRRAGKTWFNNEVKKLHDAYTELESSTGVVFDEYKSFEQALTKELLNCKPTDERFKHPLAIKINQIIKEM